MTTHVEMDDQQGGALVAVEHEVFMPALSVQQAVERFNSVVEFVRTVMREGIDYGVIPGTDKATLLKPGAEKLCTLFGLTIRFEIIRAVEDWTGEAHGGEPFFYYLYRCQLRRGDMIIAEGDGSCNSWEQKYRYREAKRKCPACGQAAIIQGREEYGGGWVCFRKRGGCGAKYLIDDTAITDQQAGRVANENVADQVNTIQKMAIKRSLICATLLAVNGSEFFTQDSEDFFGDPEIAAARQVHKDTPDRNDSNRGDAPPGFIEGIKKEQWLSTPAQKQMIIALLSRILSEGRAEADLRAHLSSRYSVESPARLAQAAVPSYINSLKHMLQAQGG